jgi:hypothetical protein
MEPACPWGAGLSYTSGWETSPDEWRAIMADQSDTENRDFSTAMDVYLRLIYDSTKTLPERLVAWQGVGLPDDFDYDADDENAALFSAAAVLLPSSSVVRAKPVTMAELAKAYKEALAAYEASIPICLSACDALIEENDGPYAGLSEEMEKMRLQDQRKVLIGERDNYRQYAIELAKAADKAASAGGFCGHDDFVALTRPLSVGVIAGAMMDAHEDGKHHYGIFSTVDTQQEWRFDIFDSPGGDASDMSLDDAMKQWIAGGTKPFDARVRLPPGGEGSCWVRIVYEGSAYKMVKVGLFASREVPMPLEEADSPQYDKFAGIQTMPVRYRRGA